MSVQQLHPADLERLAGLVADRLADVLGDRPRSTPRLVDAAELAVLLGVSRETVYANADRLGARRLGDGARPRLRFDSDVALEAWTRREHSRGSEVPDPPAATGDPTPRRTPRSGKELALVPARAVQPRPITTSGPAAVAPARGPATREATPPRVEPTRRSTARASTRRAARSLAATDQEAT